MATIDVDRRPLAKPIKVLKPGATVTIGPDDDGVRGLVSAVAIYAGLRIQYQVAWWDGRQRHNEWLEASEVELKNGDRLAVGFGSS